MPTTAGPCIKNYEAPPAPGYKLIIMEAEKLLASGNAEVSGGSFGVQAMAGFGPGWGNDAQIFWGGAKNNVLVLKFDLNKDTNAGGGIYGDAFYEVHLHLTRAPDFGRVLVKVRGGLDLWHPAGIIDAWDAAVKPPPFGGGLGQFPLHNGRGVIWLGILGKNDKSTGYFGGIDCIAVRFVKKW
jgi:hypothetical protein